MSSLSRPNCKKRIQRRIFEEQNHRCAYCHRKSFDLTLDHVKAKSKGGDDSYYNLVGACEYCNKLKRDFGAYVFYEIIHSYPIEDRKAFRNRVRVEHSSFKSIWPKLYSLAKAIYEIRPQVPTNAHT